MSIEYPAITVITVKIIELNSMRRKPDRKKIVSTPKISAQKIHKILIFLCLILGFLISSTFSRFCSSDSISFTRKKDNVHFPFFLQPYPFKGSIVPNLDRINKIKTVDNIFCLQAKKIHENIRPVNNKLKRGKNSI